MFNTDFRILQANLRKSCEIGHSLFNDNEFQSFAAILTTETWAKIENNTCFTAPAYHFHWQPYFPTTRTAPSEGRTPSPFCFMVWVNKQYANVQQIPVLSPDICAVILQTSNRDLFMASIYVPCSTNNRALGNARLEKRISLLYNTFCQERLAKPHLELILTSDFNRWDVLWGGDGIALHSRQGEGQLLVNLMADLDLQLLLPRGTVTYARATRLKNAASIMYLIFSSTRLAEDRILCTTLDTDHGSDHATIQTVFTMATPKLPFAPPRRLFKSSP